MKFLIQIFSLLLLSLNLIHAQNKFTTDVINDLPGINFDYSAKQYSGYLKISSGSNLFYWVNGQLSCSALQGLTSIGPFLVNPDGKTAFENVYAWNKVANILFVDSIPEVGFSYRDSSSQPEGKNTDDSVANDAVEALLKFVQGFPEYVGRDLYLAGVSNAGIYIPLIAKKMIDITNEDPSKMTLKLTGIAIGNGFLSAKENVNSLVKLAFYRGIIDKQDMDFFQRQCCRSQENCDFSQYVSFNASTLTYSPISNKDLLHVCSKQISELIQLVSAGIPSYNYESPHQDCYTNNYDFSPTQQFLQTISFRRALDNSKAKSALITDGQSRFVDQGSLINARSTDQFGGYRCLKNIADIYFNSQPVRKALKIPDLFNNKDISSCKDSSSVNYVFKSS